VGLKLPEIWSFQVHPPNVPWSGFRYSAANDG
jgi:hypothetical protein